MLAEGNVETNNDLKTALATIGESIPGVPAAVLTGAGISAESGLKTFRDQGGLWELHRIEDVATPEGFVRNPELVHAFYNERRRQLLSGRVFPNAAHLAVAELARDWPRRVTVITTNIDDLHTRAGLDEVFAMHGNLLEAKCNACGRISPRRTDLSLEDECPHCRVAGRLRVNVVWFGETPLFLDVIERRLAEVGIFLVVGSSSRVYPAAGFVDMVPRDALTVEINPEPTPTSRRFTLRVAGKAAETLPALVKELKKRVRS